MPQQMVMEPEASTRDDLSRVREATQELHQAISNVLAKRSAATKADAEKLVQQAKNSAELASSAIRSDYGAAHEQITRNLKEAGEKLQAVQKQASESVQLSGQQFRDSLTKALAEARASAQTISEAVAAKRSEKAAEQNPANSQS